MSDSRTSRPEARVERSRLATVSSAMLVVAAVVGVDVGLTAASASSLVERGAIVAARSVSVARVSGLESATGLGWTAFAILAVLLVRRVSLPTAAKAPLSPIRLHAPRIDSILARQRRKQSISSRSGGLYGP